MRSIDTDAMSAHSASTLRTVQLPGVTVLSVGLDNAQASGCATFPTGVLSSILLHTLGTAPAHPVRMADRHGWHAAAVTPSQRGPQQVAMTVPLLLPGNGAFPAAGYLHPGTAPRTTSSPSPTGWSPTSTRWCADVSTQTGFLEFVAGVMLLHPMQPTALCCTGVAEHADTVIDALVECITPYGD